MKVSKVSQKLHAVFFYSVLTVSAVGTLAMGFMPMGGGGMMGMSMGNGHSMHMGK